MVITANKLNQYCNLARDFLNSASIVITDEESSRIEIADFGLGEFETTGLALITYINTSRCCAKELILLPKQTCPQHLHPPVLQYKYSGKEETFRCRWGTVYLYVDGKPVDSPVIRPPQSRAYTYTVRHEIVLQPGQQYTIMPETWHWFQGGPQGAVISEFSTASYDEFDVFMDEDIIRSPEVID